VNTLHAFLAFCPFDRKLKPQTRAVVLPLAQPSWKWPRRLLGCIRCIVLATEPGNHPENFLRPEENADHYFSPHRIMMLTSAISQCLAAVLECWEDSKADSTVGKHHNSRPHFFTIVDSDGMQQLNQNNIRTTNNELDVTRAEKLRR